jgi:hypothetical protein
VPGRSNSVFCSRPSGSGSEPKPSVTARLSARFDDDVHQGYGVALVVPVFPGVLADIERPA